MTADHRAAMTDPEHLPPEENTTLVRAIVVLLVLVWLGVLYVVIAQLL